MIRQKIKAHSADRSAIYGKDNLIFSKKGSGIRILFEGWIVFAGFLEARQLFAHVVVARITVKNLAP